jgi:cobalamin-dependent methionine synthase I
MKHEPTFDTAAAHRFFAADCFNRAWELIEKPERTREDDRMMVALNQASIYHWQQRLDCTDTRLSIGYWQASRIQALLGNAVEARRHAEVSLAYAADAKPFYRGYAFEALARAEAIAGNAAQAAEYAAQARAEAERVEEQDKRELLLADVRSV